MIRSCLQTAVSSAIPCSVFADTLSAAEAEMTMMMLTKLLNIIKLKDVTTRWKNVLATITDLLLVGVLKTFFKSNKTTSTEYYLKVLKQVGQLASKNAEFISHSVVHDTINRNEQPS